MERLQAAGVPAAMMMRPDDHEHDPHLRVARRLRARCTSPAWASCGWRTARSARGAIPPIRVSPAPQHGEHTREICATVLGLSQPEIEALFAAGVLEEPLPTPAGALAA